MDGRAARSHVPGGTTPPAWLLPTTIPAYPAAPAARSHAPFMDVTTPRVLSRGACKRRGTARAAHLPAKARRRCRSRRHCLPSALPPALHAKRPPTFHTFPIPRTTATARRRFSCLSPLNACLRCCYAAARTLTIPRCLWTALAARCHRALTCAARARALDTAACTPVCALRNTRGMLHLCASPHNTSHPTPLPLLPHHLLGLTSRSPPGTRIHLHCAFAATRTAPCAARTRCVATTDCARLLRATAAARASPRLPTRLRAAPHLRAFLLRLPTHHLHVWCFLYAPHLALYRTPPRPWHTYAAATRGIPTCPRCDRAFRCARACWVPATCWVWDIATFRRAATRALPHMQHPPHRPLHTPTHHTHLPIPSFVPLTPYPPSHACLPHTHCPHTHTTHLLPRSTVNYRPPAATAHFPACRVYHQQQLHYQQFYSCPFANKTALHHYQASLYAALPPLPFTTTARCLLPRTRLTRWDCGSGGFFTAATPTIPTVPHTGYACLLPRLRTPALHTTTAQSGHAGRAPFTRAAFHTHLLRTLTLLPARTHLHAFRPLRPRRPLGMPLVLLDPLGTGPGRLPPHCLWGGSYTPHTHTHYTPHSL